MTPTIQPEAAVSSQSQESKIVSDDAKTLDEPSPPWYVQTIRAVALHRQAEKRLAILCEADELRVWSSLDDQRLCNFCNKTFNGHQVRIRRFSNGKYELRCATDGCASGPQQWEYPEAPPASDRVDPDWWRPSKRTTGSVAQDGDKANPDLVNHDPLGRLRTSRYDAVNTTLLSEFLKERRKVEEQDDTIRQLQNQIDALTADLGRVSDQLELRKRVGRPRKHQQGCVPSLGSVTLTTP